MKQTVLKIGRFLFSVQGMLILVITGGFVSSCISHAQYQHIITGQQTLVYQINTTGTTKQSALFKPNDLVRELSNKDALEPVIKRFTLRSLEIKATLNSTNKAVGFRVKTVSIKGANNAVLFSDKELPFSAVPAEGLEFLVNGALDPDKVNLLNQIVSNQFIGKGPTSTFTPIEFELEGTNIPSTALASVTLTLILDVTIEYSTCEEVLALLFPNPECTP